MFSSLKTFELLQMNPLGAKLWNCGAMQLRSSWVASLLALVTTIMLIALLLCTINMPDLAGLVGLNLGKRLPALCVRIPRKRCRQALLLLIRSSLQVVDLGWCLWARWIS